MSTLIWRINKLCSLDPSLATPRGRNALTFVQQRLQVLASQLAYKKQSTSVIASRKNSKHFDQDIAKVANGETAPAIFLAFVAVSVGMINAVCISH